MIEKNHSDTSYKIAYLTSYNPMNKQMLSGVTYYLSKSLAKHCGEVEYLNFSDVRRAKFLMKSAKLINRLSSKKIITSYNVLIGKIYGRIISKKVKDAKYDFIFADKAHNLLAYIDTDIPIVYSTDATFKNLHNYYPVFSNLRDSVIKSAHKLSGDVIKRSSLIICTSHWCLQSMVRDYNAPAEKIHIISRGANIDIIPDKEAILTKRKTDKLKLVFIGTEWERKGYDIAYKAMDYVRGKGIKVSLTVIGCNPPIELVDTDVEIISKIDKNTSKGQEIFHDIMINSDILLLPTRAECVAIAFSEAAAYGLPTITTNTGGVTEVIQNGINGFALHYDSDFTEYGEKILEIYNSDDLFYKMIKQSYKLYEERLNWDAWGRKMKSILNDFKSKSKQSEQENIFSDQSVTKINYSSKKG